MDRSKGPSSDNSTIHRIPPYQYIHVLDQTTNITRVETGPQTFIRRENERVVFGPQQMIVVPPGNYCVVENPVLKDAESKVLLDKYGQARLGHGDEEVRLEQDPFPLYPGEALVVKVTKLKILRPDQALRLVAKRDFEDGDVKRVAGDEWLFEGPGTYIPCKEVEVLSSVDSVLIHQNEALMLEASRDTVDREGNKRVAGEQWMVKKVGAYLPGAHEKVICVVKAHVLTDKTAILVKASSSFVDQRKIPRKNGEEYLVKFSDMETYIPDVYEQVVGTVSITTLTDRQFCVICNPVDANGKPQLGRKKLVKGETSFFLQPGETLESGIRGIYIMSDNEGLILSAQQAFTDTTQQPAVERKPGDRWMIVGPAEYVPPVEVEVINKQKAIPLHDNEGIYVRNVKTGQVRSVIGRTYMLTQDEELWRKALPQAVQELLMAKHDPAADRGQHLQAQQQSNSQASAKKGGGKEWDATRVVNFQVPHNAAVQLYDYKSKKSRVMFGPDLVMLGPDEEFTQLSLSGGKPKRPNVIRTMALLLGPDFCTDIIVVETADHARLSLQLAYNWHFEITEKSEASAAKLFSVQDFIGDACKAIASRIRGAVAGVRFDDFHKSSSEIIRTAVFGVAPEKREARDKLIFPQNSLVITSVDIQSVEPVDQRTRDALQKSVQLAIEITVNSQEATARHEAQRLDQEAKGRLETQKIMDSAASERARKDLLELQAASSAVESCGQAKAEAQSRAEAAKIEGEAAVVQSKLKAESNKIEAQSELERLNLARQSEIEYLQQQGQLEINKEREMAKVEVDKFKQMMEAVGQDTLKTMATAGMDQQVRLLQALGMKSTLITDGRTPINLLSTAMGLLGSTLPTGQSGDL